MEIPRALPETVFRFIEAVKMLEPCTIEQVRAEMRAQWPLVRSAKTFSEHFGLVETREKKIVLTDLSCRMLSYTGTKRIDFLISHARISEIEPMKYLVKMLKDKRLSWKNTASPKYYKTSSTQFHDGIKRIWKPFPNVMLNGLNFFV